jgi:hypothetical protein
MSTYTIAGSAMPGVAPLTASQVTQIDLGTYSMGEKKLPNKKISFDVHTAHGGYVVRVSKSYGAEDDMYVISDEQDLGNELGKIVTHHTLSKE